MLKRVEIFKLKDGVNPDKFWKFWEEVHAAEFKNFPALRKYTINRVSKVVKGTPSYWGLVEVWYDSEEEYNKAKEGSIVIQKVLKDGWAEQVTDEFTAWLEEKVIL